MAEGEQDRIEAQAGKAALLAKRYALALLALAAERKTVDATVRDMGNLRQIASDVPEFRRLIGDPRLTTAAMSEALQAVARKAGFESLTCELLKLAARNGRAALLPQIAAAFLLEHATRRGEITAHITAARPLSAAQRDNLAQNLSTATGGKIALSVREDAALIGGFIAQFGSYRIDASLRGRLAALARHLQEAA